MCLRLSIEKKVAVTGGLKLQSELAALDVVVSGHQITSDPTRSRPPRSDSRATLDQCPLLSLPPLMSLLWSRRQSVSDVLILFCLCIWTDSAVSSERLRAHNPSFSLVSFNR